MKTQLKPAFISLSVILCYSFVLLRIGQLILFQRMSQVSLSDRQTRLSSVPQPTSENKTFISQDKHILFQYPASWEVVSRQDLGQFQQYGTVKQAWVLTTEDKINKLEMILLDGTDSILTNENISCDVFPSGCNQVTISGQTFIQLKLPTATGFTQVTFLTLEEDIYILNFTENIDQQEQRMILDTMEIS